MHIPWLHLCTLICGAYIRKMFSKRIHKKELRATFREKIQRCDGVWEKLLRFIIYLSVQFFNHRYILLLPLKDKKKTICISATLSLFSQTLSAADVRVCPLPFGCHLIILKWILQVLCFLTSFLRLTPMILLSHNNFTQKNQFLNLSLLAT